MESLGKAPKRLIWPALSASLTSSRAARADAIAFVLDAYDGVTVRPGKGLPHAQAVADVLPARATTRARSSSPSCTTWSRTRRGRSTTSAGVRRPIADHGRRPHRGPALRRYAQRKRDLRARTIAAGSPVVDVALADKIASLQPRLLTEAVSDRKLRHYTVMLQLALTAGLAPGLCKQLDELIARVAALSG